jgi:hypothetical protein
VGFCESPALAGGFEVLSTGFTGYAGTPGTGIQRELVMMKDSMRIPPVEANIKNGAFMVFSLLTLQIWKRAE